MSDSAQSSPGVALAGGMIASALLDILFHKGIITNEEARTVLNNAMKATGPLHEINTDAANKIIASMLAGKYSARS
jgi:hypothetical protein